MRPRIERVGSVIHVEAGELKERRRRRRLPPMSVLPTLCTLGNLVSGFAAIHYASKPVTFAGPWGWSGLHFAGVLVFVGMLLDAVDGWVARRVRSISPMGGQLDSLADVVTFGVAPPYMMLQLVSRYLGPGDPFLIGPDADGVVGKVVWAAAVLYVCCGALRLARFNVETHATGIERRPSFRGLPSPGAAGLLASLILLHQHLLVVRDAAQEPAAIARAAALGLPLAATFAAMAMVSTIPYAHVTNRYLYGPRSFGYVARLVGMLALAVWFPRETLALVFTAYVLWGPVQMVRLKRAARRAPEPPADATLPAP
jgi:CDP-diacylglycerol--serine O-phosphatidyltransferase